MSIPLSLWQVLAGMQAGKGSASNGGQADGGGLSYAPDGEMYGDSPSGAASNATSATPPRPGYPVVPNPGLTALAAPELPQYHQPEMPPLAMLRLLLAAAYGDAREPLHPPGAALVHNTLSGLQQGAEDNYQRQMRAYKAELEANAQPGQEGSTGATNFDAPTDPNDFAANFMALHHEGQSQAATLDHLSNFGTGVHRSNIVRSIALEAQPIYYGEDGTMRSPDPRVDAEADSYERQTRNLSPGQLQFSLHQHLGQKRLELIDKAIDDWKAGLATAGVAGSGSAPTTSGQALRARIGPVLKVAGMYRDRLAANLQGMEDAWNRQQVLESSYSSERNPGRKERLRQQLLQARTGFGAAKNAYLNLAPPSFVPESGVTA